jgi:hypothetical protein
MQRRGPTRLHINPLYVPHCDSHKMGYRSKEEALSNAEAVMAEGHVKPGCHITPYRCDRCGDWHLFNRRIIFK